MNERHCRGGPRRRERLIVATMLPDDVVGVESAGGGVVEFEAMSNELYSDEETQRRFEAALRGARLASPMRMKDMVGKADRASRGSRSSMEKREAKGDGAK